MPESDDHNAPPWVALLSSDIRDVRNKQDELCAKQGEMNEILTGGSKPIEGLVVKVDRLEQSEERRKVWTTAAVGAAVTAVVASLWALLSPGTLK